MGIYKHILLATDLNSDKAAVAKKAVALAKLHHAKLSIAHIVEYIPPFYDIGTAAIPLNLESAEAQETEARKKIKALVKELDLEKPTTWVLSGDKHDEIVKLIEKYNIDLIVIGSHHHPCLHLLFGDSLPETMLHDLLCDIIVVNLGAPS